jgi:hypothetical protein
MVWTTLPAATKMHGGGVGSIAWFRAKNDFVSTRESACATASSQRKPNPATTIDKEDFQIALPGQWQEQPADQGCEFVNRVTDELLIVSILRSHELPQLCEPRDVVERLDVVRREMIETNSQHQALLGATQYRGSEHNIDARFDGHDPQHGLRFSVAIRGSATKVLTLSLYRNSLAELAIPFTVYASLIFNRLKVKGV